MASRSLVWSGAAEKVKYVISPETLGSGVAAMPELLPVVGLASLDMAVVAVAPAGAATVSVGAATVSVAAAAVVAVGWIAVGVDSVPPQAEANTPIKRVSSIAKRNLVRFFTEVFSFGSCGSVAVRYRGTG